MRTIGLPELRLALERSWRFTLGRTARGKALAASAFAFEQWARPIVWQRSAALRKVPPFGRLITWIANASKHDAKRLAIVTKQPLRAFTLPTPMRTLAKMATTRLALPTSATPEVSIIIPVYNHFELTYACLESIVKNVDGPSYEVIVVDDCSSDPTTHMLGTVDGVRVVRNEKNLGFIGACNAGAAAARGAYLVFLNNDTEVEPGWLRELRDTFDLEPNAGLVGSKLVYPDGRLQEAGGIVWRNGRAANVGRLDDPDEPRHSYLRRADYCSGASIMLPRALFEELGGFDTHFSPAYYEDTDLAFRVRAAGRDVLYQPLSRIFHFEGMTSGTNVNVGVKSYQVVNERKFAARWRDALAAHGPYPVDAEREKLRGVRGRVLVVDVMTPEPDRDSGSLRMFNMLQVLRRLGMHVTFVPMNLAHMGEYTHALQRRGIEALYHPYVKELDRWLKQHVDDYDVIVLSRPDVAAPFLSLVRKAARRARIVYDTVDLHHVREEREARLKGDTDLMRRARERRDEEIGYMRASDATLVVSSYERELLAASAPDVRVRVVSNIHDVFGSAAPFDVRRDLVFVGLMRHKPNSDAVLWFVREVLPLVHEQRPELKLYVVGIDPPDEVRALASEHVIVTGHVPNLDAMLASCKLTVAPLRFGAGVKGKINMSLSHGVPVVATSLAVEGMHLVAGREVLVADEAAAFADAIVRLDSDETLWNELSRHALEHTERHFSFAAATAALRDVLDELAPVRTRAVDGGGDAKA